MLCRTTIQPTYFSSYVPNQPTRGDHMLDAQAVAESLFVRRQIQEDLEGVGSLKRLKQWNRANSCYTRLWR
jgi:hypothetical protein